MVFRSPERGIFKDMLACVPELAHTLKGPGTAEERQKNADSLIEQHIQDDNPAQVYLGCLTKAYVHSILTEKKQPEDLSHDLRNFILGGFEVRGRPTGNRVWPGHQVRQIKLTDGEIKEKSRLPRPVVAISSGNRLAVWKICELELEREFGDRELARRLAASTARLFVPRSDLDSKGEKLLPQPETLRVFVREMQEHGCNPFAKARIMEFAGGKSALEQEHFPLVQLFGKYIDYTPTTDYVVSTDSPYYVTHDRPGAFLSHLKRWSEDKKFDYLIASNIFCDGAVKGEDDNPHGKDLSTELLPHLSDCLKEGGRLVVSNTAIDGVDFSARANKADYGLVMEEARTPLFRAKTYYENEAGIYVMRRESMLPITPNAQEQMQVTEVIPDAVDKTRY